MVSSGQCKQSWVNMHCVLCLQLRYFYTWNGVVSDLNIALCTVMILLHRMVGLRSSLNIDSNVRYCEYEYNMRVWFELTFNVHCYSLFYSL